MDSTKQIAIITGGASGIGFAVCEALASRGDWIVNIFDRNAERGQEAAQKINAVFHAVDVADYSSLDGAFKDVFKANKRLDFVFANAGIVDDTSFYAVHDAASDPPPFPTGVIDINLTSVLSTSYLAQHYLRQTPRDDLGPRSIIVTSSCGGIYAAPSSPVYAAAKHGAVGWTRSIAGPLWRKDGIRVNAILPGTVRTSLLPDQIWDMFPAQFYTPMQKIVDTVLMLLDNDSVKAGDAGRHTPFFGQTVEVNCDKHYFRKQDEYCDGIIGPIISTEP
ncbi:short-chain dehydrogenase [Xylaria flabelliformis]|nr:short-chain dehydrogenase [Xylaria flabelliformis]